MKTEVPYDLIAKYFAGQCNENEVNEVEKWKKAGTENESEFRQLKKAWENTALAEYIINTEAALSKVSSQISTKKETQSIFMKSWMRIAAVFILGIACFSVIYFMIGKGSSRMLTAENTTATPISISLSDGSRITLKSGSVLNYPRKFTKLSRTISFSGEAYFEIARDEKRPFVIESGKAITRVLGTKFNLRAYAKDTAFTVTVTEGLVAFGIDNKLVHVQKGETGKITISSGQVSRFLNTDPNFMAWKTGIFTFSDTRVDDALKQLSAFYGTSFVVETPELDSALFNFTSDSLSIQELIDNLEIALDAQIIRKENAYYIRQLN